MFVPRRLRNYSQLYQRISCNHWPPELASELAEVLDEVYDWDAEHLKAALDKYREAAGWKPKDYFMTLRLVLTGRKDSPPLVESIVIIGREMTRFRLRSVRKALS